MEVPAAWTWTGILVFVSCVVLALVVGFVVGVAVGTRKQRGAEESRKSLPHAKGRSAHETDTTESGTIERELIDYVTDAHGFEYAHYMMRDRLGNSHEAWCRIIPTTIPFTCPDCQGMVEGVGAKRVWPGTAGPAPQAYRCAQCGRQEDYDFGVPRITMRESEPVFSAPRGVQPVGPREAS